MPIAADATITQLDEIVAELPFEERALFERIFHVSVTYGELVPPDEMHPWIERQFGSVEATRVQKIVRVTNNVTLDGVMFNYLRSNRPMWRSHDLDLEEELRQNLADPFSDPYRSTPADPFGRVRGRFCVTAANIAKFDGFHAVIVFDEPHPLRFAREDLHDYIDTGTRWAMAAHAYDPEARYYLFIWNCLWRAGASLLHGHAQVMLGRDVHYAAVEKLRRNALMYEASFRQNYFEDLFRVHQSAGCAFEVDGVRVFANLAPVKENEILLIAPALSPMLKDRLYDALDCLRQGLNVTSFNVAIYQSPIAPTEENWEGFPVIVRIVDRGDPTSRTADIGAMELYAASVVSSDPLRLARLLREHMST